MNETNTSFQVLAPSPGESITEVQLSNWVVADGSTIKKNQVIAEVESEKASLEIVAEANGVLKHLVKAGDNVEVGKPLAEINAQSVSSQKAASVAPKKANIEAKSAEMPVVEVLAPSPGESITEVQISNWLVKSGDFVKKNQVIAEIESEKAALEIVAEASGIIEIIAENNATIEVGFPLAKISPSGEEASSSPSPATSEQIASVAALKLIKEKGLDITKIKGSAKGGRITKEDVLKVLETGKEEAVKPAPDKLASEPKALQGVPITSPSSSREENRQAMSMLRRKISERLVAVKNQTAMLTTFNEVDLSSVIDTRKKYKEIFKEKHNIGLGFMSFFAKACTLGLKEFPLVNGQVDGTDLLTFNYVDLGIAVSAPKGLMVPVIRNANELSMAQIEQSILTLAKKARDSKLTIDEMTGGTFTITNGGVFGSMLSTPILNPPQSAILGMHNIVQRPVAEDGQVVIKPIMYLALSYDHRIVDGKDSVSFLKRVKTLLEDPVRLLLEV